MEENKTIVTVVTPSYNRAKQLPNLYKSLICQSTLDFIWLIVLVSLLCHKYILTSF